MLWLNERVPPLVHVRRERKKIEMVLVCQAVSRSFVPGQFRGHWDGPDALT
ncbi:MAG: hypothetical protein RL186_425 [Pseudomonadota bacterium]